jgi:transcriptional regulator with XRE-family HTH domain
MATDDNTSFASALRRALQHARASQADLARELRVDPSQVSRWVNGKAVPHFDNVRRIEEALDADLSDSF